MSLKIAYAVEHRHSWAGLTVLPLRCRLPKITTLFPSSHSEIKRMIRPRIISTLIPTAAITVLLLLTLPCLKGVAISAPPNGGNQADSKTLPADAQAQQLKELQKQVADLQTRVSQMQSPRIVAAGTATIKLPGIQDNKQKIRVKLPADIAARLGTNCIVQLTNRFPTGGAFFVPYWKPATDGFDIHVADPSLNGDYQITPNDKQPYYIDWVVVQK
jgi:hypothetical protein